MKRLPRVCYLFFITVGSLLLAGCDVPEKAEDHWRESFFLRISPQEIQRYLGTVLVLLIVAGFVSALISLARSWGRGKIISAGFVTSLLLMFSIPIVVLLFIDFTTRLGELVLPAELTLESVLAAMRWELSPDLGKLASAAWGVSLTFLIPLIVSRWQIVMLIATVIALAWSILGRSIKGIAFIIGEIFGWVMFITLFNAIIQFFGSNYPDWAFGPVTVLVNVFYTGTVILTMFFCYVTVPFLTVILTPELGDEEEAREVRTRRERPPVDWDQVFAPWERSRRISRDGRSGEVVVPESNSVPLLPAGASSGSGDSGSEVSSTGPSGGSAPTPSGPVDANSPTAYSTAEGDVVIPGENGPNQSSPTPSPKDKADKAKRVVGGLAMAINLATIVAAPEAAPIVIPVVNANTQVAGGLIDRKAAKEAGQDPENTYPKRRAVGDILQAAGKAKGSSNLTSLGEKISRLSEDDDILIP